MIDTVTDGHPPFLDVPVEGVIEHPEGLQRPVEELRPLFDAVRHDPGIVEFGWKQYTPYDPLAFGIRYLWVRTTEEPPDATPADLWIEEGCPSLGSFYIPDPHHPGRYRKSPDYHGPDYGRFERVMTFHAAVDSGAFNSALRQAFGDPSAVTVRSDAIHVEPLRYHD